MSDPDKFLIEELFARMFESFFQDPNGATHQLDLRMFLRAVAEEWADTLEGQRLLGPDFPTAGYRSLADIRRVYRSPEFSIYHAMRRSQLCQEFNQEAIACHANVKRIQ